MSVKEIVAGTIITLVIGGTAYTVNQADVISNFADDTGMSQEDAEQYVKSVDEDDLVPYDEVGASYAKDGRDVLSVAVDIDCVNYRYEWESPLLSCDQGKEQLNELANDEIALGDAYTKLASKSASKADISKTVGLIDEVNSDLESGIVRELLDTATITENKNTNSYNKAMLQAALEDN